jgi:hypothetical protein
MCLTNKHLYQGTTVLTNKHLSQGTADKFLAPGYYEKDGSSAVV